MHSNELLNNENDGRDTMLKRSIVICGLPSSGKTTFLAALWHLVTAREPEIDTALKFGSLKGGDYAHLNSIQKRWLKAEKQERTELKSKHIVAMNLVESSGDIVRVSFPDLSGETFRLMWEVRECDPDVAEILKSGNNVLLFIHADNIKRPRYVVEDSQQMSMLGLNGDTPSDEVDWSARVTPTQVPLVDILQMLNTHPLNIGPRRIALILSAWDKVVPERLSPDEFLKQKLPLLYQYLYSSDVIHKWRVYGVSAQGGDYETEADSLLAMNIPSKRIMVVHNDSVSHDLTEPLQWLTI